MADVDVFVRKFKIEEGDYMGFTYAESHYSSSLSGPLEISNVYCGPYSATASNGFCPQGVTAAGSLTSAGETGVLDLVMPPKGNVTVTVLSHDDNIVEGASVTFQAGTLTQAYTTDAYGKCTFNLVPAGGFYVEASYQSPGNDVFVGELSGSMGTTGATVEVTLTLKGFASVGGTVKTAPPDETVVPGARVTLKNITYPYETKEVDTDDYGTFRLVESMRGILPSMYWIHRPPALAAGPGAPLQGTASMWKTWRFSWTPGAV
jgi:hypothetical protein